MPTTMSIFQLQYLCATGFDSKIILKVKFAYDFYKPNDTILLVVIVWPVTGKVWLVEMGWSVTLDGFHCESETCALTQSIARVKVPR